MYEQGQDANTNVSGENAEESLTFTADMYLVSQPSQHKDNHK